MMSTSHNSCTVPLEEGPQRVAARIPRSPTLEQAVAGADYAQESTRELVAVKEDVFKQMDATAMPQCIPASSTVTIPAMTGRDPA